MRTMPISRPAGCVVCGGTSDSVVWHENGYEGRACKCGTLYVFPTPSPGAVDPTVDGHPPSFYSTYAGWKARWVRQCCPAGTLLEVGCGDGYFLAAAQAVGYRVAGIDPHPGRARRVAESLNIEVRCSLLEDLHWPEARFDVVYHCDLLSHFPDPLGALRKMKALLAPGGMLAFEVGTLGGIRPVWYHWIGSLDYPQHRWLYSEASLHMLLQRRIFVSRLGATLDWRPAYCSIALGISRA